MESFIRESGDKLDADDKAKVEELIKEGKEVSDKNQNYAEINVEDVKATTDKIAKESANIFQKFYQQHAQDAQNAQAGTTQDANGENVDFDIKDA